MLENDKKITKKSQKNQSKLYVGRAESWAGPTILTFSAWWGFEIWSMWQTVNQQVNIMYIILVCMEKWDEFSSLFINMFLCW